MSKLEDICYHMYESSGNSKYVLAGRKPLHPDEAVKQIKDMIRTRLVEEMSMTIAGSDGHRVITNLNKWVSEL